MPESILVYGWYGQNNVGDEFFAEAFRQLFPECNFKFVSHLEEDTVKDYKLVFIGGGSFLNQEISASVEALNLLKQKKISYLSVGLETNIHPTHLELLKLASLVVVRTSEHLDKILAINPNAVYCPDLAYALQDRVYKNAKIKNSVLFMPNISVVPVWSDPYWKHTAWNSFKVEVAQFIDVLIDSGYTLDFFPMCQNSILDDAMAAVEIRNLIQRRGDVRILPSMLGMDEVSSMASKYETIITQRFHGIILSEMIRVPCISIHHHDKLKYQSGSNSSISYNGVCKNTLSKVFCALKNQSVPESQSKVNEFNKLQQAVRKVIANG